ncbi:MAG: tetratricopeptide repeat protein [Bacteroidota bacterium]
MAKNINKRAGVQPQQAAVKPAIKPTAQIKADPFTKPWVHAAVLAGIALVTWLFLGACLDNQLTNWDDPGYIRDNPLIKDLSGEGLNNIFSTSVMGNYHPLTILTYAIDYSYARLDPMLYHRTSLLFHIATTLLVYWLVLLLLRRPVAAIVASLLFGLHPMHMESVAWLAGRKDVVYGAFYVAACIAHVYYARAAGSRKWLYYAGVLALFVLSLLGKPVAVILPVTLLLIDYFEGRLWKSRELPANDVAFAPRRQFNIAILLEKLPLFAIAVGFGIRSLQDQKDFGALATENNAYNFVERIALGGYALITYLWKAVVPAGLSNFYPYPEKDGSMIHVRYFLFPALVIVLAFLVWRFARKNKYILFGLGFFLVNIALLLQFIPVGGAIIADRYSYIPYLGLFFIAGWLVSQCFEPGQYQKYKMPVAAATIACLGLLGWQSDIRCRVWYDTTSLWRDEIEKQPKASNAFNNLGFNYFNMFNESVNPQAKKVYYDSAFYLLNRAIEIKSDFANPMVSLGELYRASGNFPMAKEYYYRAIKLNDKEGTANAYLGLAIVYSITQNFDSARICFQSATASKDYFPEAHSNFGNYYDMMSGQEQDPVRRKDLSELSLKEYGTAIAQNPDMYAPYLNRARKLFRMERYNDALADYQRAMNLQPELGEVYYWRAICYHKMGNIPQARQDLDAAIKYGYNEINPNFVKAVKG